MHRHPLDQPIQILIWNLLALTAAPLAGCPRRGQSGAEARARVPRPFPKESQRAKNALYPCCHETDEAHDKNPRSLA
jgi:hypothetical protein